MCFIEIGVEKGFDDKDADEGRLKENRKKDSKALFILVERIPRLQGDSSETPDSQNQMRSYGEKITDAIIAKKVLRSLTAKYDYIVTAIEEAKDLLILSFDELMSSLQAREAKKEDFTGRGRGRGGFRGRGRVRLGDNKQIQVEGKGTIAMETSDGKVKLLYNVYFVPSLAHSLLSVGQLMMGGYVIVFDNGACVISDKDSGKSIVSMQMTENKMFPLKISNMGNQAFIDSEDNESKMWHLRYGHLNIKGMQLLNQKGEETQIHIPMEDRTTTEGVESSPLESPTPSPSNSRSSSSSSFQESSDEAPPAKRFEMSDMRILHYFLGLEVKQGVDGIFILQRKYATDLLKRIGLFNCIPATTPMNINEKLQREEKKLMQEISEVWFMQNPTKHHLGAAKRILRYVAETMNYGIYYTKVSKFDLYGFTDSDWASSVDDRKSTSANVFNIGSGAISWSSKK
ncbi:hypothetical protein ZIOFF_066174 [Zingiber officinale]|uniref:Retrovirus-related Pol polyprotein from transposon TNT 1-94-like beta-barrel domain-containing protein n=1 Tax=Zingiber officinale TaxID=94328 RepID=A0A8J5KBY5_ZINOF|nr:hypothetical protein ZIOFF_066174 [Zingiber officinale]